MSKLEETHPSGQGGREWKEAKEGEGKQALKTHKTQTQTLTRREKKKIKNITPWQPIGPNPSHKVQKQLVGIAHWVMDPRVEMAFFTSSTLPAENLNTGETEACLGNWSFSRVLFLAWT